MNIKLILPFVTLLAVSYSEDITVGSNTNGKIIYEERTQASPAIWRQIQNVTVNTTDNEVISRIVITDLRPDKDGDAKIVEGGEGQKAVTIELKSPTVLRGYDFKIQVYSVPDTQGSALNNLGKSGIQQPRTIAEDVKTPKPLTTDIKVEDGKRHARSTPSDQARGVTQKGNNQDSSSPIPPSLFGSDAPLKPASLNTKTTSQDEKIPELHTDKPSTELLSLFDVERSTHIPAPQKDLTTKSDVKRQADTIENHDQVKALNEQKNSPPAAVAKAITPAPEKDLKTNPGLSRQTRDTKKDEVKNKDETGVPVFVSKTSTTPSWVRDVKTSTELNREARDTVTEDNIKTQDNKNSGLPSIVGKSITPAPEKDLKTNPGLSRQARDTKKENEVKNKEETGVPVFVSKAFTTPASVQEVKTSTELNREARDAVKEDNIKTHDNKNSGLPSIVGKSITPAPEKDLKSNPSLSRQARDTKKEEEFKTFEAVCCAQFVSKEEQAQYAKSNASPSFDRVNTPALAKDNKPNKDVKRQTVDAKNEDSKTQDDQTFNGSPVIIGKATPAPEKDSKTNTDLNRQVRDTENEKQTKNQDINPSVLPEIFGKALTPEDKTQTGQKTGPPSNVGKPVTPALAKDLKPAPNQGDRQARDTKKEDEAKIPAFVREVPVDPKIDSSPKVIPNYPINKGNVAGLATSTTEKSRLVRDTQNESNPDGKESKVQSQVARQGSLKSVVNDPKIPPKVNEPPRKITRSTENADVTPTVTKEPTIAIPSGVNSYKATTDGDSREDVKVTKANGQDEKKPVISIQ